MCLCIPQSSPVATPPFPFQVVLCLVLYGYGSGLLLYSSTLIGAHLFTPLDPWGLLTTITPPLVLSLLAPILVR